MLHFDEGGELKRAFLLTAVDRNKNPQLRLRALQEIAAARDAEAFDRAIEMVAAGRATRSARASRSCCRRWPRRRSAGATRPTTGSGRARR
jgi:hypothetical protein